VHKGGGPSPVPANDSNRDPTLTRETALSDRNVNFTTIWRSLAMFTFLMIFLSDRTSAGDGPS